MQDHPKRHGYLSLGSRVPKQPLRDSTAYEMGRSAAANGETLLSPSEFVEANAGYDIPVNGATGYSGTYGYYQRGYTTWHKERNSELRDELQERADAIYKGDRAEEINRGEVDG